MAWLDEEETPSDKAMVEPMLVNIKSSKNEKGEKEEKEQQLAKKACKNHTHYLFHGTQPHHQ